MRKPFVGMLLAALLLSASSAFAQATRDAFLSSTTCPGTGCVTLGVSGLGSASIQIVGGGTWEAVAEGSVDGATFATLQITASDGSGSASSATAAGLWTVPTGGLAQVRVRLSSHSSGSPRVYMMAIPAGAGGSATISGGAGDASAANQVTGNNSLSVLDDWDETDRAKVNLIAGQAGITAGAGAVGASTPRVTLASDDPAVASLGTLDDAVATISATPLIRVGIFDAADGQITTFGGGNQEAEDAGHTTGDVGTVSLAVRNDAGTPLAGTDLDYIPLTTDNTGALRVTGGGGGTEVTEDTAHSTGVQGGVPLVVRSDSVASLADTDGDYAPLQVNATGSLRTIDGNSAALLTSSQLTDNLVQAEDAVAGSAFAGVGVLAVRQDSHTDLAADGDFIPLTIDADGGLRVSIVAGAGSGGTAIADDADFTAGTTSFTPAGGFYQSTVTACTDGDACAAGITAQRTLKVTLFESDGTEIPVATTTEATHDAALTAATTIGGIGMLRASATEPTNVSAGDDAVLPWGTLAGAAVSTLVDFDGDVLTDATANAVRVAPAATTSGGGDGFKYTSAGATEDEHAVKATAGTLYSITVTNTNAAARYLRCENDTAANTAPGSETPEIDLAIPGATTGAGFTTSFPVGYSFSTALTCWLVTGAADTDVAEVAADEIKVFYTFK